MSNRPQKRDNDYYLERLRIDHPGIYADLISGKFKNATEAFVASGLRKPKTGFDRLQSAWRAASTSEQDAFKAFIGCVSTSLVKMPAPVPAGVPTLTSAPLTRSAVPAVPHGAGYLTPDVVAQIKSVMSRRKMKLGDVMFELGFKKLNPSLGLALNQGSCIRDQAVLDALAIWLTKNPALSRISTGQCL